MRVWEIPSFHEWSAAERVEKRWISLTSGRNPRSSIRTSASICFFRFNLKTKHVDFIHSFACQCHVYYTKYYVFPLVPSDDPYSANSASHVTLFLHAVDITMWPSVQRLIEQNVKSCQCHVYYTKYYNATCNACAVNTHLFKTALNLLGKIS
jgi:hypothetical protein